MCRTDRRISFLSVGSPSFLDLRRLEEWARLDSDQRPTGYEPAALTTELRALTIHSSAMEGGCKQDRGGQPAARVRLRRGREPERLRKSASDFRSRHRSGAGDGIRTRGYQLGRLMPYHLATPARPNRKTLASSSRGIITHLAAASTRDARRSALPNHRAQPALSPGPTRPVRWTPED